MNTDGETTDLTTDGEYGLSLLLDDLETLLEEIDEQEGGEISGELRERMVELHVESVAALRTRIIALHERLDSV